MEEAAPSLNRFKPWRAECTCADFRGILRPNESAAAEVLEPTPSAVKTTATEKNKDYEDNQKRGAIHGSLQAEPKPNRPERSCDLVLNVHKQETFLCAARGNR